MCHSQTSRIFDLTHLSEHASVISNLGKNLIILKQSEGLNYITDIKSI